MLIKNIQRTHTKKSPFEITEVTGQRFTRNLSSRYISESFQYTLETTRFEYSFFNFVINDRIPISSLPSQWLQRGTNTVIPVMFSYPALFLVLHENIKPSVTSSQLITYFSTLSNWITLLLFLKRWSTLLIFSPFLCNDFFKLAMKYD